MNSVSVLVVVCISLVAAKVDDSKPAIEYTCKANGDIEFDLSKISATYHTYAVGPNDILGGASSQASCAVPLSNITRGMAPTNLTQCKFPVYLYVMKEHISKEIFGGKDVHEYILSCDLPDKGLDFTAVADIKPVTYPTIEPGLAHFDIQLTMAITPSTVAIGDQLTVSITEHGPALGKEHVLLPKFCEATDGTSSGKKVTLLEHGETRDSDLLADFDVLTTKGIATTTMYAFKFLTSSKVHIICTVTVCNDATCVDGAYNTTTTSTLDTATNPPKGRRRRSAKEAGPETYKVSAAFKIIDKETTNKASSQSMVRVDPMVVLFLLLATIATTLRKI